jgi:integrase
MLTDIDKPVARALRWTILTAARTSETLGATWAEINGDTWTVPANRIKAGREHRVPLTDACVPWPAWRGR